MLEQWFYQQELVNKIMVKLKNIVITTIPITALSMEVYMDEQRQYNIQTIEQLRTLSGFKESVQVVGTYQHQ
jgi:hypothetical protein